ncbi:MAG: ParB/RepB/Spo0J family partition protein [Myxococcales bacterium]|nr:ParB/RepB/Spo0J family partition protein [Myxococcales bacterium]
MSTVRQIPINKVRVINPRARNKTKFAEIVDSIAKLGVKKPITVCQREGSGGEFDLICGQGRLEAVAQLGMTHVPALVVKATEEQRYVMSLIENLCRCRPDSLALVRGIAVLEQRGGYTPHQIAEKIGISDKYVRSVLKLYSKGEELLLAAVERGDLPIHVAVEIATAKDGDVKKCLAEAYERGALKGKAVARARALVERRMNSGKRRRATPGRMGAKKISADDLVRTYKRSTQKQAVLAKRAHVCESMLRVVCGALRELTMDEHFVTLLRAETLDRMPKYIADQVKCGVAA